MSRSRRSLKGAFVLACLGGLVRCGGPDPVLLLTLDGIPAETARIRVTVSKGGSTNAALFERNDKNLFVVSPSPTMAAMLASPSLARVALDLPAAAVGDLLVKVTLDRPDTMGMMGMMPAQLKSYDMACASIPIEAGKVNTRLLMLKEGATCP